MNIELYRPICFFNIEATGTKIVQYTTAMHGLCEKNVINQPTFKMIAGEVSKIIENSYLAGYNSNNFNIPLLAEELLRARFNFNLEEHNNIDVQVIFHKMEPRTLTAAYKYYCNKKLLNIYQAQFDVLATYEIFKVKLNKYQYFKKYIKYLSTFSSYQKKIDLVGLIKLDESGNKVFNIDKQKGKKNIFNNTTNFY